MFPGLMNEGWICVCVSVLGSSITLFNGTRAWQSYSILNVIYLFFKDEVALPTEVGLGMSGRALLAWAKGFGFDPLYMQKTSLGEVRTSLDRTLGIGLGPSGLGIPWETKKKKSYPLRLNWKGTLRLLTKRVGQWRHCWNRVWSDPFSGMSRILLSRGTNFKHNVVWGHLGDQKQKKKKKKMKLHSRYQCSNVQFSCFESIS